MPQSNWGSRKTLFLAKLIPIIVFICIFPLIALADDTTSCSEGTILLQVPLGGVKAVANFGCYLQLLYQFSIGIVGIVGITMVMIGGVRWITAAGNPSKVQQGKDYIFSAIVGIILLLGAYTILNFINPQLTNVGIDISGVKAPPAASLYGAPPAPTAPAATTGNPFTTPAPIEAFQRPEPGGTTTIAPERPPASDYYPIQKPSSGAPKCVDLPVGANECPPYYFPTGGPRASDGCTSARCCCKS